MTGGRMYSQRASNISVFRGCSFNCVYCSFKRLIQMNKKCPDCAIFKPHSHIEVLKRTAPSTKAGNFVTLGLSSDISFMDGSEFYQVLEYCHNHPFTTFLIQSKNPEYFLRWQYVIPRNVILGTTIETVNTAFFRDPRIGDIKGNCVYYSEISRAPHPVERYEAMLKLNCRKAITVEPILAGDLKALARWIININPEFCYLGYNSNLKIKLPEPPLAKTLELIERLRGSGFDVREKLIRKAFYE